MNLTVKQLNAYNSFCYSAWQFHRDPSNERLERLEKMQELAYAAGCSPLAILSLFFDTMPTDRTVATCSAS